MSKLASLFRRQAAKPDNRGDSSALHLAVADRDIKAVTALLSEGENVYAKDIQGHTPLHLATQAQDHEMMTLLLSYDRTDIDTSSDTGTALMIAATQGDIKGMDIFLAHGGKIDAADIDGTTPLQAALFAQQYDAMTFLLERGADVAKGRSNDENALHLAAQSNDTKALGLLLRYAQGRGVNTPTSTFKLTPLHQAVRARADDTAKMLIEAGANPNIPDSQATTALHTAAKQNNVRMLYLLAVEAGADINKVVNPCKYTALHTAVFEKQPEAFDALVRYGADAHQKDDEGRTPLNIAGWNGCLPIVKIIMEATEPEPDTEALAASRLHALYDAVFYEYKDVTQYLLDSKLVDLNRPTRAGDTVLMAALQNRQLDIAEDMLKAGAKPDTKNKTGNSALFMMASKGDAAAVALLLKYKADPNMAWDSETPLHSAVAQGHETVVPLLLAAGANPLTPDQYKRSAVDIARWKGRTNLVPVLLAAEKDYANRGQISRKPKPFQGPKGA